MLIDAIPLFNELDLLEIRLTELAPVVDRFVIVESTRTHAGDPKPLYFDQAKERYAHWLPKIRHVIVDDMPIGGGIAATRRREMFQRNAILRGVFDCAEDDVILISDCDEIPRAHMVPAQLPDGVVLVYMQKLHYFNVNTYAPSRPWPGTRACRVSDARAMSPHIIRNGMGQPDALYPQVASVPSGGWHYSYFGGVEGIQDKMRAFLHQELVNEETTNPDVIASHIEKGEDVWGRTNEQSFVIGAASDLPLTILKNPMKWAHLFASDWQPVFHEDWYEGDQAVIVGRLAQQAPEGAIVEIGCWEGRSTAVIAQCVAPRVLHCVDHWKGNGDEGVAHPAALAAAERNVYADFRHNYQSLTASNLEIHRYGWQEWAALWKRNLKRCVDGQWLPASIAFLHLDASHDRASVRDCLEAIKPFLVPDAILCGDDAYHEGVAQGVHDVFPGATVIGGRLWVWRMEDGISSSHD